MGAGIILSACSGQSTEKPKPASAVAPEKAPVNQPDQKQDPYTVYKASVEKLGFSADGRATAKQIADHICTADSKTVFALGTSLAQEAEKTRGKSVEATQKTAGEIYASFGSVASGYCPEHGAVIGEGIAFFKGLSEFK